MSLLGQGWRGKAAPPSNPRAGAPTADRRIVTVGARFTLAEQAAWQDEAALAGESPSALLQQAMARTWTRTAPALAIERDRTRQIARIGSDLNKLARWASTHGPAVEAVAVIARLVAFERTLRTLARLGTTADGAHYVRCARYRLSPSDGHPSSREGPEGPCSYRNRGRRLQSVQPAPGAQA